MTNLNERKCDHCQNLYSLIYYNRYGSPYTLKTRYCSKSCAARASYGKGCILPDIGADALRNKALDYMKRRNTYCTLGQVAKGIGHSSKSFVKHKIRISVLNAELGFVRPRHHFQSCIGQILKDQFPNTESEKVFDGLVGVTGHPLRVDFYIPEINTVVEADGSQHSNPNHPWHKWKNGTVAEYDRKKNEYFEKVGIRVIRIPYKKNIKDSDVLSHLS